MPGGPISDVINGVWPYVIIMLGFTVFLWYVPDVGTIAAPQHALTALSRQLGSPW